MECDISRSPAMRDGLTSRRKPRACFAFSSQKSVLDSVGRDDGDNKDTGSCFSCAINAEKTSSCFVP